jgi:hypothetical protein
MTIVMELAHGGDGASAGGSAVASWTPLVALLTAGLLVAAALFVLGRPEGHPTRWGRFLLRIPNGLERITGVPGWAAATALTSMFGLLVAGVGFYSDVAYHIAFGRDELLFTAPHVLILVGLVLILVAAIVAVVTATLSRADTGLRLGRLQLPWSSLPLGVIGVGAVLGFPIDELWHQQYGVDVTMWSPPHLMMILGAALTGLASWLVVAESGVRPEDGPWARGFHVAAAWLTLLGVTAPAGEFYFGVPQWQQLFHPVLLMLAAAIALIPMRLVLGAGWALGIAIVAFVLDLSGVVMAGGSPIETRPAGIFIGSALAVEVVARFAGTRPRTRFALLCGLGIGTLGLGVEWLWNSGAHQPWTTALLPEAVIVGLVAAVGAATLGTGVGYALRRERAGLPAIVLVAGGVAVAISLVLPIPREVGEVQAEIRIEHPEDDDHAIVHARLDPPDAAEDARWFMASSWQGGDRVTAHMQRTGPGEYVSERPVEVSGNNKSLLRLHRGAEMMAIAIRLPADEEIGEPEIPAEDRTTEFVDEEMYLQREVAAHDAAGPTFRYFTFGVLAVLAVAWLVSLTLAARGLARTPILPRGSRDRRSLDPTAHRGRSE